jgi:hypothetical protein
MDGIDEYRGREFDWAVDTVWENASEVVLLNAEVTATTLVDAVWEFIEQVFVEEGLEPPSQQRLITAIQARLRDRLILRRE